MAKLRQCVRDVVYWENFYKNKNTNGRPFLYNATNYALHASKSQLQIEHSAGGTIAEGASVEIPLTITSQRLFSGTYYRQLVISSNDPENSEITVPITIKVKGAPKLEVSKDSLDFGGLYTGLSKSDTVWIHNRGTDTLKVSSLSSTNDAYSANTTQFALLPLTKQSVIINFAPNQAGNIDGEIVVKSNSKDSSAIKIVLTGQGIDPPVVKLSEDSIRLKLLEGQEANRTIQLLNKGGSTLSWDSYITYTQYEPAYPDSTDYSFGKKENFIAKSSPFQEAATIVAAPNDGVIFAKETRNANFYKFDVSAGIWEKVADAPYYSSSSHSDGTYLKRLIYFTFPRSNNISVYNIAKDQWSALDIGNSQPGDYPSKIASDGTYLYVLYTRGGLIRYDPAQNQRLVLATSINGQQ
ncbi:MAG: choice-of-anchor D domain-containing protein, partial [Bacteroidota bacterium]